MEEKIFTIIIPAYNSKDFLERCLASLISNKKFIYEVIIVDDCSDYTYDELIKPFEFFYKISLYRNKENYGAGVSRRIGITKAKSEWITFIDADDCLTPNSLRYVCSQINEDLLLLHTKTIYYETGFFNKDNISFSNLSCGGNFYKREYLIKHNLLPSFELRRVEDEYFNDKIITYINAKEKNKKIISFDYPVYEVHHDFNDGQISLALSNKEDYFCCSRLKYYEILIKDFIGIVEKEELEKRFLGNLLFVFLLSCGLSQDEPDFFKSNNVINSFKNNIKFYYKVFNKSKFDILVWFNNLNYFDSYKISAVNSVGAFEATEEDFVKFIKDLEI